MPELRWTLLILGVLFIAALAWWELRRPRQARRSDFERRPPQPLKEAEIEPPRIVHREPSFTMPEIRPRESAHDLPVVEIADDSMIGLRIDGQRVEQETVEPEESEPVLPVERERASERVSSADSEMMWHSETEAVPASVDDLAGPQPEIAAEIAPLVEPDESVSEARRVPLDIPPIVEPVVDWPEDSQRRILALRLVAAVDRFSGRAVRQALSAEGFMLGKFAIYHKAGPDGRAVLSAASLTKPGTFDAETVDTKRFGGLNLFAVLPGPLMAQQAFEELLSTARSLNERLQGGLQDDRGQPLTPTRIQAIREGLAEEAPADELPGPSEPAP